MKFCSFTFLLWGLSFSVFSTDLPSRIDIRFEIITGIGHGELNETLEINQKNGLHSFRITSEARASGILKLIKPGSIERESQGIITEQGLQPSRYTEQRGKKPPAIALLDWEKNLLTLQYKDKDSQEPLPAGTLDRLSLSYNFMFSPINGKFLDVYVTDGRSLQPMRYLIDKEMLETPIGKLETIVLTKQQNGNDKLNRKIWLATTHHMLPVRITSTESDGLELEKIVTEINLSYTDSH